MVRIFDKDGNELYLCIAHIINPVEHIIEARDIAFDYMTNVEGATPFTGPQDCQTIPLSDDGQAPATHYWCMRTVYTNAVEGMVKAIKAGYDSGYSWCADREYTLQDGREAILSKFCVVCCNHREFLQAIGKRVVG